MGPVTSQVSQVSPKRPARRTRSSARGRGARLHQGRRAERDARGCAAQLFRAALDVPRRSRVRAHRPGEDPGAGRGAVGSGPRAAELVAHLGPVRRAPGPGRRCPTRRPDVAGPPSASRTAPSVSRSQNGARARRTPVTSIFVIGVEDGARSRGRDYRLPLQPASTGQRRRRAGPAPAPSASCRRP